MKKLKKILLIDDDQVNNYLNEIILTELNIAQRISIELNGLNGYRHLLDHCQLEAGTCPELVILDYQMPVMNGLEMIKNLKASGFMDNQQIVFILLCVHVTAEHIEEFKKAGIHEYTTKPLSKEVMLDAYHKYFAG